jgi:hypothetical protein
MTLRALSVLEQRIKRSWLFALFVRVELADQVDIARRRDGLGPIVRQDRASGAVKLRQ